MNSLYNKLFYLGYGYLLVGDVLGDFSQRVSVGAEAHAHAAQTFWQPAWKLGLLLRCKAGCLVKANSHLAIVQLTNNERID